MTIDELMRDIAPKMRKGWVYIDDQQRLCYSDEKPCLVSSRYADGRPFNRWDIVGDILPFDISPVDDWTQSLRSVGNE